MLTWRDFSIRARPLLPLATRRWRVTALQAFAIAPPFVVDLATRGPALAALFVTALVAALFWETLFAFARHSDLTAHGLTTAMLVTLFLPLEMAPWQAVLAVSLGVVLAELVFGGRGFGFVNAAAASLALLAFSFPALALHPTALPVALACLPGLLALMLAGLLSWRVLVATAIVSAVAIATLGTSAPGGMALAVGLTLGLIFFIADPMAAATTNLGRWAYGALAGFLVAVFAGFSTAGMTPQSVIFAALLASIFAPLLDHLMVIANAARRRRWRAKRQVPAKSGDEA